MKSRYSKQFCCIKAMSFDQPVMVVALQPTRTVSLLLPSCGNPIFLRASKHKRKRHWAFREEREGEREREEGRKATAIRRRRRRNGPFGSVPACMRASRFNSDHSGWRNVPVARDNQNTNTCYLCPHPGRVCESPADGQQTSESV